MSKATRKAILAGARLAAADGNHSEARRLFASVGISYVTPSETAALIAWTEGN